VFSRCTFIFSPLNAQRKSRAPERKTRGVLFISMNARITFIPFFFLHAYMHVNAKVSNIHQLDIRLPVIRVARRTIGARFPLACTTSRGIISPSPLQRRRYPRWSMWNGIKYLAVFPQKLISVQSWCRGESARRARGYNLYSRHTFSRRQYSRCTAAVFAPNRSRVYEVRVRLILDPGIIVIFIQTVRCERGTAAPPRWWARFSISFPFLFFPLLAVICFRNFPTAVFFPAISVSVHIENMPCA